MKNLWIILSLILLSCDEDVHDNQYYFSGEVVERLEDGSLTPLADKQIRITFYKTLASQIYSLQHTEELITDSNGNYEVSLKSFKNKLFDVYSVNVVDTYFKNCNTYFVGEQANIEYFQIEQKNYKVVEACSTSLLKISANKLNDSSGNTLYIDMTFDNASFSFTKIELVTTDDDLAFNFYEGLESLELGFRIYDENGVLVSNTSLQAELIPGTTKEFSIDF